MFSQRYSAVLWLAIYVALQVGASLLSPPPLTPLALAGLALLSAGLFIFISLAICASLTAVVRRPAPAALLLAIGAAGWLLMLRHGPLHARMAEVAQQSGIEVFRILAAVGIGVLVANIIRERNILLPAAVFAAFADFFMVRYGTVHIAMKSEAGQKLINKMSAEVPRFHPSLPKLTVGMADFIFLAFFFACVYRFDLYLKRTFVALFVLLTASLFFVSRIGPIPALAPMALGFVAVNFRRFKLSHSEVQAMGAAAAIVLVAALAYILLHRG